MHLPLTLLLCCPLLCMQLRHFLLLAHAAADVHGAPSMHLPLTLLLSSCCTCRCSYNVLLAHAAADVAGAPSVHLPLTLLLSFAAAAGVVTTCCWRMPLLMLPAPPQCICH
jgi:hypothetical protein